MSISNDDALEIIERLKCAAWGGPPATVKRMIYLDDAELVIWDQTEIHGPDYCKPQDETEIDWKARYEALEEAVRPFVNQWRGKGAAKREHYKRLAEVFESSPKIRG